MVKWNALKTEYSETKHNKLELLTGDNGQVSVKIYTTDEDGKYSLRRTWTSLDYWNVMNVYSILKRNFIDYDEFIR